MIIADRTVEESVEPDRDLTHTQRFAGLKPAMNWLEGRDLRLGSGPRPTGLPRSPLGTGPTSRLWIPPSHSTTAVTGPVYDVRVSRATGARRVTAGLTIHYVPEIVVELDGERFRVAGSLDGLDPSSISRLRRLLNRGVAESAVLFPLKTSTIHPETLPPAAKTILRRIESEPVGSLHVREFERRGASHLVDTLARRGDVIILDLGLLVSAEALEAMRSTLPPGPEGNRSAREFAAEWHVSVGVGRQILKVLRNLDTGHHGVYNNP